MSLTATASSLAWLRDASTRRGEPMSYTSFWRSVVTLLTWIGTLRIRLLVAVIFAAWILLLHPTPNLLLSPQALAQNISISGFTEQVSPNAQSNATEPSVAVDRSDGTVYVAWQASGTHVARSDDGGRTFVETPINNLFGSDVGDV